MAKLCHYAFFCVKISTTEQKIILYDAMPLNVSISLIAFTV